MIESSLLVSCAPSKKSARSADSEISATTQAIECNQLPPAAALIFALDSLHAGIQTNFWLNKIPKLVRECYANDHLSISAWLEGIGHKAIDLPQVDLHIHELLQADLLSMLRAYLKTNSPRMGREADWFHFRATSFRFSGYAARRALEQENLIRSQEEESWVYHRCRWRYRLAQQEQLGHFCNNIDAARHARSAGIFFHPDQLLTSESMQWPHLMRLLDFFEPGFLANLINRIGAQRHLELLIPTGSWALLRPLLSHVFSGEGLPFMEIPGSMHQSSLPPCPEGIKGMIVHHLLDSTPSSQLESLLEHYERQGWKVLLVHGFQERQMKTISEVKSEGVGLQKGGENLFNPQKGQVLPLKEFVRRIERRYIHDVLGLHSGIKTHACESLAITRQTLYTKLSKRS